MADKIVVLQGGTIEQYGTPLELYHQPRNRFVAGFIGNPTMNFLPATCLGRGSDGVRIRLDTGGEATVPVEGEASEGERLTLGIRPDDLRTGEGTVTLTLDPEVVERLGNQTVIYTATAQGDDVVVIGGGAEPVELGRDLRAGFEPSDAHLFREDGSAFERRVDFSALADSA